MADIIEFSNGPEVDLADDLEVLTFLDAVAAHDRGYYHKATCLAVLALWNRFPELLDRDAIEEIIRHGITREDQQRILAGKS